MAPFFKLGRSAQNADDLDLPAPVFFFMYPSPINNITMLNSLFYYYLSLVYNFNIWFAFDLYFYLYLISFSVFSKYFDLFIKNLFICLPLDYISLHSVYISNHYSNHLFWLCFFIWKRVCFCYFWLLLSYFILFYCLLLLLISILFVEKFKLFWVNFE